MDAVRLAFFTDCAVITVTTGGEDTEEFKDATEQVLAKGFGLVKDEYFDRELDRYVYVFTPLEDR